MAAERALRQLVAARMLAEELGRRLQIDASLRLWDGSLVPLGPGPHSKLAITIGSPGVISSILRRPTLDRIIRHYAHGHLGFEGGTLIDLGERIGDAGARKRLRQINKRLLLKSLWPFLFSPAKPTSRSRDFTGNVSGKNREKAENRDFIKFHYDVGNPLYRLFLDPWMQYSCGYFTKWENSVEQAQEDKLEMICRKLRLAPGESFLDIGCGWGGLICYAAEKYGVRAHGVTLSEAQLEIAAARIREMGLEDRVTAGIKDYADLTGSFDKIASIGMYEHIGLANVPLYFGKVKSLLAPGGLFLNHAISRRAKKKRWRSRERAERQAIIKYIFPGGELDDIGGTLQAMETCGFEVHDVECWRAHYALTTRHWCERLTERREEAAALVGAETYRIWAPYLAGCSLAFTRGSLRIYQTLASRTSKGKSPVPLTRADLYL
ncbi:MAG: cyclopropane-fatty-acyl-phospholipid synthase family protein [Rhodomicrobium sp.]